jgi:NAD(P)-dependent dehydrogenase (short-subunit alcohol dehydrogenase family)
MKTVLITGASSGIGRATAQLFAQRDWNVVATMRDPQAGEDLFAQNVLVEQLDVRSPASIEAAVAAGITRYDAIDVVVNNAGFGLTGIFETTSRAQIQEQFEVNVFGVMEVTRTILPHFRQNRGGTIVNISSGAGIFTLPMMSLYCASKFALEGFSESLAFELASQNIAVKLVVPHGGVTGTRFSERSAEERAGSQLPHDYEEFMMRMRQSYAEMVASRSQSAVDIAEVIWEAATDGTDRLRYLVGDDSRGFIKARRELPDQEYVEFMRSRFPSKEKV